MNVAKVFNFPIFTLSVISLFAVNLTTLKASANNSATITLTGTIRDFKAYRNTSGNIDPNGHPDFERKPNTDTNPAGELFDYGLDQNITTNLLSNDKKPIYKGGSYSTTTQANFDQWYRDVSGVNQSKSYQITLNYDDYLGKYVYENNSFFPIDNQLFGNQGRSHNYHFTYAINSQFTYQGGETFKFIGDDDVWVYINGTKVVDIGGVHGARTGTVTLDENKASELGLEVGQTYDFDFFFAERHTTESHFRIETTLAFTTNPDSPTTILPD
jgi:fibro-slime domain-containing protein